ncbi:MFS transporter [Mixta intestinalis]|jgi:OHS family lactose permease-like MFS transporter|uniref:Lactose permease n=1 Tax=Mixta intestinalis TaxID=1615494 RepID=A0A6P1Q5N6_9GAMM|nr:MFS transporter [Mixta intestinalis]QHM73248.1 Lactose permease [Mixta intestinalis]
MYYLRNTNFWMFGLFFFFYFFIMGAYFPFFPIWLHDINHLSKSDTGIVFASISLFSLLFQPVFGLLSDKLGLKKHLLWIITGMLVMFAPFFIYVLGPLLQANILLGAIVGGIYLGFIYNGGAPAIEAYVEKVSRRSQFEFGRARMFGCVGWALCASIVGIMFTINNQFVFWLGSGCAVILAILLFIAKPQAQPSAQVADTLGANHSPFSLRLALELFKDRKLWFLSLYVVGVSCTYDVFDQQFANFFTSFFATGEQGTRVFGYVTTMGELLNATIMFFAPLIVNRIGGKNALLLAGTIMSVRIIGSSFATSALEVVVLKTLHMFEVPFLIVGCFKYITSQFEVRFSATIYLVCFCFFKQLSMIFMSLFAGYMYDSMGFHGAYLVLGLIAFSFTLISLFTLSGEGPLSLMRAHSKNKAKPA